MTASADFPLPPARWAGILSPRQWHLAALAIGEPRLEELRELLGQVSETYRAAFVAHLARIAVDRPAGAAVLLALAWAAYDVRPEP